MTAALVADEPTYAVPLPTRKGERPAFDLHHPDVAAAAITPADDSLLARVGGGPATPRSGVRSGATTAHDSARRGPRVPPGGLVAGRGRTGR